MSDDVAVIGARIRDLRRRLGMTQVDFAVSIGVARSHLTNAELGKAALGLDKMIAMAREYGASLDWLTGLVDRPTTELQGAELLKAWRAMSDEARAGLAAVVKSMAAAQSGQEKHPPERPFVGGGSQKDPISDSTNVVPISRRAPAA